MQVVARLPQAPTDTAVRRMMQILEEKGHVTRTKAGREFRYQPVQSKEQAGSAALQKLLDTFFNGALDEDLALAIDRALEIPRAQCRLHAESNTWDVVANRLKDNLVSIDWSNVLTHRLA